MSMMMIITNAGAANALNDRSVRVWGDISSIYRTRDYDSGESRASEWLNMSSIYASSYIWRPWFALINGGVSFSVNDYNATGQERIKDQYVAGKIQFDLFPTSRFPFTFYANHSRNKLDDDIFFRDTTNTELGLTQQYRSKDGRHNYRGNYNRNYRDDRGIEKYISDSLLLSSSNQLTDQTLYGDVQYDNITNELREDKAISYSVTGRQSYNGYENINIENLVSSSLVNNDFINTTSEIETRQLSSLFSWRPGNKNYLNVTGSLRISEFQIKSELIDQNIISNDIKKQENLSLNINQGLIYNYSNNVLISESVNGLYTQLDNDIVFTGNETVGISFTPDSIKTSFGDYNWSIGAALNNQHGDVETEQSLNNQLSHSLSDNFIIARNVAFHINMTQLYNYEYRTVNEDAETIGHSLSLSWSGSGIKNNSAVRFLFSDSRTIETQETSFQLINLQLSGQIRFNRYTSLASNLTLQKAFQETSQEKTETRVTNGQLKFVRDRLFKVPRLKFWSELEFSKQLSESERLISEFTSNVPESDVSWKNNLDYMIGRFESRLSLDYIKNDDEYDRLIKIQITRYFGDL